MIKDRFVAHSRVMRALVEQVRRFAAIESNVLITGETGAGKNAVARELHARGPRAKLPFVTIDCASLAGSLKSRFGGEITIRPGKTGQFDVIADGVVIFSKALTGRFPLEGEVEDIFAKLNHSS